MRVGMYVFPCQNREGDVGPLPFAMSTIVFMGGVGDYNNLPKWAKPIACSEASLDNAPP
jgi:hypothetical protein